MSASGSGSSVGTWSSWTKPINAVLTQNVLLVGVMRSRKHAATNWPSAWPPTSRRKKQSVALARTVLQRRLASSTQAIAESIRRRFEKQEELLDELESLSPAQRAKRLAQIQGRLVDVEQDEDDLDDAERDLLTDEYTTAIELDQLRAEIAALRDLLAQARRVRDHATDSKLTALRECLAKAEFNELKDGRGRLRISP